MDKYDATAYAYTAARNPDELHSMNRIAEQMKEERRKAQKKAEEEVTWESLPPRFYHYRAVGGEMPIEGNTMNTTTEALDATSSVFRADNASIEVGSDDHNNQYGHRLRFQVEHDNGDTVVFYMTPELADRYQHAIVTRSSEVRHARRR